MKRFVLLAAATAALLVPTTAAVAEAPRAHPDGVSKIPPELCLAVLGSDFERLVCSG
jgi:hypothetical protein